MVKMTGAQFKAFLSDPSVWEAGTDVWCEDDLYLVDGVQVNDLDPETLSQKALIGVIGGVICSSAIPGGSTSFESYLRKWLKRQASVSILVECDHKVLESVKDAIKKAGGKIKIASGSAAP